MKSKELWLLLVNLVACCTFGQTVIFGTNNYVEYQVGTLPLVISVAHGGGLEPSTIPNRTCNNPVFATDVFTIETALEIKNRCLEITGCSPHLIISHLKRNKLDPNRNLADGACGHLEAILAWNEFHDFISDAQNTANQQFNNQTFFVDLHGHGNPLQRIELGYLLYDDELELPDNTLNTNQYLNYSSIKNLALNNVNNYTHAQLLRGPFAFGTLLANENFPAVPSQSIPFPGTGSNYFSGGYITANHTCYNPGTTINGLQMELNYENIRDSPTNRALFAEAFTQSIVEYLTLHFGVNWNPCLPLSTIVTSMDAHLAVYPSPVSRGELLRLESPENTNYTYEIFNVCGKTMASGEIQAKGTFDTGLLSPGMYLLRLINEKNEVTRKIYVE